MQGPLRPWQVVPENAALRSHLDRNPQRTQRGKRIHKRLPEALRIALQEVWHEHGALHTRYDDKMRNRWVETFPFFKKESPQVDVALWLLNH